MDEEDLRQGLRLIHRGGEYTPDQKVYYASFLAHYISDEFTGKVEFETTDKYLLWFAQELSSFFNDFKNEAESEPEFSCGAGEEVYFYLKFSRFGLHGDVLVECKMKQDYRCFLSNDLCIYHIVEFQQVRYISDFFCNIANSKKPGYLNIIQKT